MKKKSSGKKPIPLYRQKELSRKRPVGTRAYRSNDTAVIREDPPLPTHREAQPSLSGFDELSQTVNRSIGAASSVALHNALRRYGLEGEEAFLVLASRYLEIQEAARDRKSVV